MKILLTVLIVACLAMSIWALPLAAGKKFEMNFFTGNVEIERDGKKISAETGMPISERDTIITGKDSSAHIYDSDKNYVISVGSSARISIKTLSSSGSLQVQGSIFDLLKKDAYARKTTTAAVRGNEEGKVDIDWSDGDDKTWGNRARRDDLWKLHSMGEYGRVLSLTAGSRDLEEMFLHASASYSIHGVKMIKTLVPALDTIIAKNPGNEIKSECQRIIAALYFETGRYDLSYKYMSEAVKYIPEKEINETNYYILAATGKNTGHKSETGDWLGKMKKYYPSSRLLDMLK